MDLPAGGPRPPLKGRQGEGGLSDAFLWKGGPLRPAREPPGGGGPRESQQKPSGLGFLPLYHSVGGAVLPPSDLRIRHAAVLNVRNIVFPRQTQQENEQTKKKDQKKKKTQKKRPSTKYHVRARFDKKLRSCPLLRLQDETAGSHL